MPKIPGRPRKKTTITDFVIEAMCLVCDRNGKDHRGEAASRQAISRLQVLV